MFGAILELTGEAVATVFDFLGFEGLAERFEPKNDPRNFPPPG